MAGLGQAACLVVSSRKILAGDLAAAVPAFQALDPATPLGFAPLPGTRRVLSGRELRLIARQHSLDPGEQSFPDVCVTRLVQLLTREQVEAALEGSLAMPDARIDVVEFSNQPAASGPSGVPAVRFEPAPARCIPITRSSGGAVSSTTAAGARAYGLRCGSVWSGPGWSRPRTSPAGEPIRAAAGSGRERPECSRFPPLNRFRPNRSQARSRAVASAQGQRIPADALQDLPMWIRGETVHVSVIEGARLGHARCRGALRRQQRRRHPGPQPIHRPGFSRL